MSDDTPETPQPPPDPALPDYQGWKEQRKADDAALVESLGERRLGPAKALQWTIDPATGRGVQAPVDPEAYATWEAGRREVKAKLDAERERVAKMEAEEIEKLEREQIRQRLLQRRRLSK